MTYDDFCSSYVWSHALVMLYISTYTILSVDLMRIFVLWSVCACLRVCLFASGAAGMPEPAYANASTTAIRKRQSRVVRVVGANAGQAG